MTPEEMDEEQRLIVAEGAVRTSAGRMPYEAHPLSVDPVGDLVIHRRHREHDKDTAYWWWKLSPQQKDARLRRRR